MTKDLISRIIYPIHLNPLLPCLQQLPMYLNSCSPLRQRAPVHLFSCEELSYRLSCAVTLEDVAACTRHCYSPPCGIKMFSFNTILSHLYSIWILANHCNNRLKFLQPYQCILYDVMNIFHLNMNTSYLIISPSISILKMAHSPDYSNPLSHNFHSLEPTARSIPSCGKMTFFLSLQ